MGNSSPATTITINVEPGAKVPIGTKITLTATLNPMPVGDPLPDWWRECLPKKFGAVTGVDWNGLTIEDCVGSPGKYRYEIVLVDLSRQSTVVEFQPPDTAEVTISDPTFDPDKNYSQQMIKATLKVGEKPLGPCAHVCFKERVTSELTEEFEDERLFQLYPGFVDPFPRDCMSEVHGNPGNPAQITMKWESPTLIDVQWFYTNRTISNLVQGLPVGTVVLRATHEYPFYGRRCSGGDWGPLLVKMKKEAKVKEVTFPNGDKVKVLA